MDLRSLKARSQDLEAKQGTRGHLRGEVKACDGRKRRSSLMSISSGFLAGGNGETSYRSLKPINMRCNQRIVQYIILYVIQILVIQPIQFIFLLDWFQMWIV